MRKTTIGQIGQGWAEIPFDDALQGMMTWLAVRPLKYAIPPSQVAERLARHRTSAEKLAIGMAEEIMGAYEAKYMTRGRTATQEIDRFKGGDKGYRVLANVANGQLKEYLDTLSWQIGGPTSVLHLLHWSLAEEVTEFPEIQADGMVKDVKDHFKG